MYIHGEAKTLARSTNLVKFIVSSSLPLLNQLSVPRAYVWLRIATRTYPYTFWEKSLSHIHTYTHIYIHTCIQSVLLTDAYIYSTCSLSVAIHCYHVRSSGSAKGWKRKQDTRCSWPSPIYNRSGWATRRGHSPPMNSWT